MHTPWLVVPALLALGCNWGMRPAKYPPARGPTGAIVAVRITGEGADRTGELFAVDSSGVTMREQALIRIPWTRVHAMDVEHLGQDFDVLPGALPDSARLARLASVSRFPQGLSGPLLRDVLTRLGQDSVRIPPAAPDDAGSGAGAIELDSIAAIAASATVRFRDRRVAMAEGYRRVGADFPGMGEHWVNFAALLHGAMDPRRPSFLTYARVRGEPRLLGLGFIVTTGDSAPARSLPGWPAHWHEHSGLLADESGARVGGPDRTVGTRVWVLHVWTALANPDGPYAADNWSLPYVRAGVTPPAAANAAAARAFALADDDAAAAFLTGLLDGSGMRTSANAREVDAIVARARARSADVVGAMPTPIHDRTVADLAAVWNEMTSALERVAGPRVVALLAPPHQSHAVPRARAGHAH